MHFLLFEEKHHKRDEHQSRNSSTKFEILPLMPAVENKTVPETYSNQLSEKTSKMDSTNERDY